MTIKRILLTGDDGYNSIGTRLLIRALKDKYDLRIAATKTQQSGVGGKISMSGEHAWGEEVVDGVPAIWVDGTPCDAAEVAQGYFSEPFDLVISGMNLGPNVSSAIISSGTYSAAVRSLGVNLAPRAMAISWDASPEFWLHAGNLVEDISKHTEYPGGVLGPIVEKCIEQEFWGVNLLNVNVPKVPTNKVRFCKIQKDVTKYFSYPISINRDEKTFTYVRPGVSQFNIQETNPRYDVAALEAGYITITPCAFDTTHYTTFEKLEQTEVTL